MIFQMAHQLQKSDKIPMIRQPRVQQFVLENIMAGRSIGQMARRIAKGDRKKYNRWYMTIIHVLNLEEIQTVLMGMAQAGAITSLPGAVDGAGRRAASGRMDGVRWIGEVTGFHNPRVRHEHSGEVKISLNMPRPVREESIIDAAVIED